MEILPSTDERKWTLLRNVIGESDYVVVIVGNYYGTTDAAGMSYTEAEYRYALGAKIPTIPFLLPFDEPEAVRLNGSGAKLDRLKEFRRTIEERAYRPSTPASLAGDVAAALSDSRERRHRPGWMRVSESARITSYGHLLTEFHKALRQAKSVVVSHLDGEWVLQILASLILFRADGGQLTVIRDSTRKGLGRRRYKLLRQLGCDVIHEHFAHDSFVGIVVDAMRGEMGMAITLPFPQSSSGRVYRSKDDKTLVAACDAAARRAQSQHDRPVPSTIPAIVPFDKEELLRLVQRANYYGGKEITFESVKIDDVRPIRSQVPTYKVEQARDVIHLYEKRRSEGLNFFDPVAVTLANVGPSVLIPPVIERMKTGEMTVADGHSRLYVMRELKHTDPIWAVVVSGVSEPTPSTPCSWTDLDQEDGGIWPDDKEPRARQIDTRAHEALIAQIEALPSKEKSAHG